jgi:hypothetical protein
VIRSLRHSAPLSFEVSPIMAAEPPNGLELRAASRSIPYRAFEGQLPGGSGDVRLIIAQPGRQGISNLPHASRVSCSELLGGANWLPLSQFMASPDSA